MQAFDYFTVTAAVLLGVCACQGYDLSEYRRKISFFAFSESNPEGVRSEITDTPQSLGCDPSKNFTFVTHGWLESIGRPWARQLVGEFLKLNGNCVFFMDYSNYSVMWYFSLTGHFDAISGLLAEKVATVVDRKYPPVTMFGFSFGARLVLDVGMNFYKRGVRLAKIYACDPAGPGFGGYSENTMIAAENVQCVHTSNSYGTSRYDCHQNWRMGRCGESQPGHRPFPYGSHGLCPYIFVASFNVDFVQDNFHKCSSSRKPDRVPDDLIMGPRETRLEHYGDMFAPTAENPPWNVVNGVIKNDFVQFPPLAKSSDRTFSAIDEFDEEDLEQLELLYDDLRNEIS